MCNKFATMPLEYSNISILDNWDDNMKDKMVMCTDMKTHGSNCMQQKLKVVDNEFLTIQKSWFNLPKKFSLYSFW